MKIYKACAPTVCVRQNRKINKGNFITLTVQLSKTILNFSKKLSIITSITDASAIYRTFYYELTMAQP